MDGLLELDRCPIYEWRSNERFRMLEEIKSRVPEIDLKVDALVDEMTMPNGIASGRYYKKSIAPVLDEWKQSLFAEFHQGILDSAAESELSQGHEMENGIWSWGDVASLGGGAAAMLAPLAIVPLVVSTATVTTTSFFFITSSAISLPILAIGISGLALTSFASNTFRAAVFNKFKNRYRKSVKNNLLKSIVGNPKNPGEPSICGHLLNEIDVIAQNRLENLN